MTTPRRATDRKRERIVLLPKVRELAIARAMAGVSVNNIAEDLGTTPHHISHVMTGNVLSNKIARQLAEYFGRPVEELFKAVDLENPDQASAA
jgi:transcriptional regulator with XRE-family HTH domain